MFPCRFHITLICGALVFSGVSGVSGVSGSANPDPYLQHTYLQQPCSKMLAQRYDVHIVSHNLEQVFPAYWLEAPILATYEPVLDAALPALCGFVEEALDKYPVSLIRRNLKQIGLAKRLYFYGSFYGATYTESGPDRGSLFLSQESTSPDADTRDYIMDSVHHEFSSLLMKKYPFPMQQWRQANTADFAYAFEDKANPGLEAMRSGQDKLKDDALFAQGFLSAYAMSSVEEDFNVFSGVAFLYPDWMIELAQAHEPLRNKLVVWLDFHLAIDAAFKDTPVFQKYLAQGYRSRLENRPLTQSHLW